uniref:Expressed protein n=2 Tax=Oryza sativa subsp. japonica TaxID=39947 RepID=Q53QL0_ORYSJ|nr:hypothetical protein LOC_Os11g19890 [Oryza sativa Japonica Group]ABA93001.1 expressed protein [Oryza sativa Japonica Group]
MRPRTGSGSIPPGSLSMVPRPGRAPSSCNFFRDALVEVDLSRSIAAGDHRRRDQDEQARVCAGAEKTKSAWRLGSFCNRRAPKWIPKTPLNRRTTDDANSKERREMAAGNFWVRYTRQFLDFNLNSLTTVELRMASSITPCLYGPHAEIDQSRTTTNPTSEVAIGYMSSFKQKSGATFRVTNKGPMSPSPTWKPPYLRYKRDPPEGPKASNLTAETTTIAYEAGAYRSQVAG